MDVLQAWACQIRASTPKDNPGDGEPTYLGISEGIASGVEASLRVLLQSRRYRGEESAKDYPARGARYHGFRAAWVQYPETAIAVRQGRTTPPQNRNYRPFAPKHPEARSHARAQSPLHLNSLEPRSWLQIRGSAPSTAGTSGAPTKPTAATGPLQHRPRMKALSLLGKRVNRRICSACPSAQIVLGSCGSRGSDGGRPNGPVNR